MGSKLGLTIFVLFLNGCSGCGSKLTLPDAGGGGSSEHSGSSGASGSEGGRGGDSGSSDGDAGMVHDADAGPDAAVPVEIDRSGLIPTSGSQLLLKVIDGFESNISRLAGLDIETGELHELMKESSQLEQLSTSPDGRTLTFGGTIVGQQNIFVAHALDDGLIPARPVEGLEQVEASFYLSSWGDDGRFAAFIRVGGAESTAVDLVDTWRHRLHWSAEAPPKRSASAEIAPKGEWLSFVVDVTADGSSAPRGGFGRITDDGVEVIDVANMFQAARFSRDGSRAIYATSSADPWVYPTYYRDMAGEAIQVVADGTDDLSFGSFYDYSFDSDHVLAAFYGADKKNIATYSYRHLSLSDGTSSAIGAQTTTDVATFALGSGFIVYYQNEDTLEVVIEDPSGSRPRETIETFSTEEVFDVRIGVYGDRHATYEGSANPRLVITTDPHPDALRFVARDDDGVLQRAVIGEPEENAELCRGPVGGRGALLLGDGSVALLDLSAALARRLPAIQPEHGGRMSCPCWSAEGGAFAVTESLHTDEQDHTWIHVARWPQGSAEPSALQLVHDAEAQIQVLLARP